TTDTSTVMAPSRTGLANRSGWRERLTSLEQVAEEVLDGAAELVRRRGLRKLRQARQAGSGRGVGRRRATRCRRGRTARRRSGGELRHARRRARRGRGPAGGGGAGPGAGG